MQEYRVIVVDVNGDVRVRYYKPGTDVLHRLNGPAIEYADGYKAWYVNGRRHREDGPAVEYADQYGIPVEYWIEGEKYSKEEFLAKAAPVKEMTMAQLEKVLGHEVKIIK